MRSKFISIFGFTQYVLGSNRDTIEMFENVCVFVWAGWSTVVEAGECDLTKLYFISGPCVTTIDDCKKSCMELDYYHVACLGEVGFFFYRFVIAALMMVVMMLKIKTASDNSER